MVDLAALREANIARDREWNSGKERVSLSYRGNELAGEAGEACNVIKKLERVRIGIRGSVDTTEHLAEELADLLICADLIAMDCGIDLGAALAAKFNATSAKYGFSTRLKHEPPLKLTSGCRYVRRDGKVTGEVIERVGANDFYEFVDPKYGFCYRANGRFLPSIESELDLVSVYRPY